MHTLLERLGRFASRRRWWVVGVWLVLLAGLTLANRTVGGSFVNDYTVPGSQSSTGLDVLQSDFPSASGYSGQILFHADQGKVADESQAVAQTMKNVAGLPRWLDRIIPDLQLEGPIEPVPAEEPEHEAATTGRAPRR